MKEQQILSYEDNYGISYVNVHQVFKGKENHTFDLEEGRWIYSGSCWKAWALSILHFVRRLFGMDKPVSFGESKDALKYLNTRNIELPGTRNISPLEWERRKQEKRGTLHLKKSLLQKRLDCILNNGIGKVVAFTICALFYPLGIVLLVVPYAVFIMYPGRVFRKLHKVCEAKNLRVMSCVFLKAWHGFAWADRRMFNVLG